MSKKKHTDPFYLRVRVTRNQNKIEVGCLPVRLRGFDIDYAEYFHDLPGIHGLHTDGVMFLHDPGDQINWYGMDQFFYTDLYRLYGPPAMQMAKALTRYNKALLAVHDKNGPPASLGQAVQWAVLALGAAGIVFEDEDNIPVIYTNGNVAGEVNRRIGKLQGDTDGHN